MKLHLVTLAALALAASVAAVRAEPAGETEETPVQVYLQSLDHAAPKAISEGRQAAPVAASAAVSAAQSFVIERSQGER